MYKLLSFLFLLFIQVNIVLQNVWTWTRDNKEALIITITFVVIFVWAFVSLRKKAKDPVVKYKVRSLRPWDIIILSENGILQEVNVISVDLDKDNPERRVITYSKPNSSDKRKFHKIILNQDDEVEWIS